jgi:hypothetical protein
MTAQQQDHFEAEGQPSINPRQAGDWKEIAAVASKERADSGTEIIATRRLEP